MKEKLLVDGVGFNWLPLYFIKVSSDPPLYRDGEKKILNFLNNKRKDCLAGNEVEELFLAEPNE